MLNNKILYFQNKIRHSLSQAVSKLDTAASEDAIYEAASGIRELELWLQEDSEEWSGDDSPK